MFIHKIRRPIYVWMVRMWFEILLLNTRILICQLGEGTQEIRSGNMFVEVIEKKKKHGG